MKQSAPDNKINITQTQGVSVYLEFFKVPGFNYLAGKI